MEHEHCAACGFDGSRYSDEALLAAVRELGQKWKALLGNAGTDLRVRPQPRVWSAIEYAAHSRDITALHAFGVQQALTQDEPSYPPIESDELIETAAAIYGEAAPIRWEPSWSTKHSNYLIWLLMQGQMLGAGASPLVVCEATFGGSLSTPCMIPYIM